MTANPPDFDHLVLDLGSEGASLRRLGVVDSLSDWCQQHSFDPQNVYIKNWSNNLEVIPFTRMNNFMVSHFFWMSQRYWCDVKVTNPDPRRFGFFVGRKTFSRARMLYDMWHDFESVSLLSSMISEMPHPWQQRGPGIDLEDQHQWFHDVPDITSWFDSDPVISLDYARVSDQYRPDRNTNWSLVQHYKDFDIELVAESYTLGDTFFPTEKTVRPLMAEKPFFVYGPTRFLKHLRTLGFQTYHDFWDESYDELEGRSRWDAMHDQINIVAQLPLSQYQDMMAKLRVIAAHNRERLTEMIKSYQPQ